MDQTATGRSLAARHFGQSNFDRDHSEMCSDFSLRTHRSMNLIGTWLLVLLPLVARTEEAASTYANQRSRVVLWPRMGAASARAVRYQVNQSTDQGWKR